MNVYKREEFIQEIDEIIQDAKEEEKITKYQAYYLYGRIRMASETEMITLDDFSECVDKLERIFGFTVDDIDLLVH